MCSNSGADGSQHQWRVKSVNFIKVNTHSCLLAQELVGAWWWVESNARVVVSENISLIAGTCSSSGGQALRQVDQQEKTVGSTDRLDTQQVASKGRTITLHLMLLKKSFGAPC